MDIPAKIRVAVVGYGNVGRHAVEAVMSAPDMELCGIVEAFAPENVLGLPQVPVVAAIWELERVDTAILSIPSRDVEGCAVACLQKGINTVDSYDIHSGIVELRRALDKAAKQGGSRAVLSAGWDPGSDSLIRILLEACAPKGITHTNFGPGMSMGHTVAVKAIGGVENALSVTIPAGSGVHRRVVYVQLAPGAAIEEVTSAIKADPYFAGDETRVIQVDNVDDYLDTGHGVSLERRGRSGVTSNQNFRFSMRINNPALTSQVMVSCARAGLRQAPGAYTLAELPVIDLLPGEREAIIRRLV
jgi:diaminopimelate dehydrogenase